MKNAGTPTKKSGEKNEKCQQTTGSETWWCRFNRWRIECGWLRSRKKYEPKIRFDWIWNLSLKFPRSVAHRLLCQCTPKKKVNITICYWHCANRCIYHLYVKHFSDSQCLVSVLDGSSFERACLVFLFAFISIVSFRNARKIVHINERNNSWQLSFYNVQQSEEKFESVQWPV